VNNLNILSAKKVLVYVNRDAAQGDYAAKQHPVFARHICNALTSKSVN
jgi:hypothetical protein